MDFSRIEEILRSLEREGVRYAIFGGAALNLHGIARFTEDIDLFILPAKENVESLKAALRSVYDDPEIDGISADDLLGDYPAIQYVPPDGGFHVDILTRLGTAFRFEDLEIDRMPFGEIEISVVSPRTLYQMKRDTVRLKDRADAALLHEKYGVGDA